MAVSSIDCTIANPCEDCRKLIVVPLPHQCQHTNCIPRSSLPRLPEGWKPCKHGILPYEGCGYCLDDSLKAETERKKAAIEQAQRAALRQRLGDIAAGATWHAHTENHKQLAISWAIMEVFRVPVNHVECGNLDSLAAWLWERGCR